MSGIQVILALFLVAALLYLRRQNAAANRLLFGSISLLGLGLVLFPDVSTRLAHGLGVGRGTDLVLYLGLASFYLGILILYNRQQRLEQQLTHLVRELALQQARQPVGEMLPPETSPTETKEA